MSSTGLVSRSYFITLLAHVVLPNIFRTVSCPLRKTASASDCALVAKIPLHAELTSTTRNEISQKLFHWQTKTFLPFFSRVWWKCYLTVLPCNFVPHFMLVPFAFINFLEQAESSCHVRPSPSHCGDDARFTGTKATATSQLFFSNVFSARRQTRFSWGQFNVSFLQWPLCTTSQ